MPTHAQPYLGHAAALAAVRAALVARDEEALLAALPSVNWYRFHVSAGLERRNESSSNPNADPRLADDLLLHVFGDPIKASPLPDTTFQERALLHLAQSGYRVLDANGVLDRLEGRQGPAVSTLARVAYQQALRDEAGMSLLHISVLVGVPNLANVKRVLAVAGDHGAVNQRDDEGDTPWNVLWANDAFGDGGKLTWLSVVDALLAAGARLDLPNAEGLTGLEAARQTWGRLANERVDRPFVQSLAQRVEAAAAAQRQEVLDGQLPEAPAVRSPRL